MHNLGKKHWDTVKCILRYLKDISNIGLVFDVGKLASNDVVGHIDSDYGGDIDRRRSRSGYIFTLCGDYISWRVVLRSTLRLEAEYVAFSECVQ